MKKLRLEIIETFAKEGGVFVAESEGFIQFEFSYFPNPDDFAILGNDVAKIIFCGKLLTIIYGYESEKTQSTIQGGGKVK